MSLVGQFFLYNVVVSVIAGLLVLGVVLAGVRLLGIRHGALRACLLTAPLIKSSLVLVGLTLFLPWPRELFSGLQRAAVPPEKALPLFLVVGGLALAARFALRRRGRALMLHGARPADDEPRLVRALDHVMAAYHANDARIDGLCPCAPLPARPPLMTTARPLTSPVAVTTGPRPSSFRGRSSPNSGTMKSKVRSRMNLRTSACSARPTVPRCLHGHSGFSCASTRHILPVRCARRLWPGSAGVANGRRPGAKPLIAKGSAGSALAARNLRGWVPMYAL